MPVFIKAMVPQKPMFASSTRDSIAPGKGRLGDLKEENGSKSSTLFL